MSIRRTGINRDNDQNECSELRAVSNGLIDVSSTILPYALEQSSYFIQGRYGQGSHLWVDIVLWLLSTSVASKPDAIQQCKSLDAIPPNNLTSYMRNQHLQQPLHPRTLFQNASSKPIA